MRDIPEIAPEKEPFGNRLLFDVVLAFTTTMVFYLSSREFDLFAWFIKTSQIHHRYQLGDLYIAFLGMGLGALIFAWRRFDDQRDELRRRLAAERAAARLAMHDALTGMPNRRLFEDRLIKAIARAKRRGETVAVMMIDIDRFKPVNDLHGHEAGDHLLIQIAERFQQTIRQQDTLARFGGDEFAVIQVAPDTAEDAPRLTRRLIAAAEQPFDLPNARVGIGLSIGVAIFPNDADTPSELVRRADVALYRAKQDQQSAFCFYEGDMDTRLHERAKLERELRDGIAGGEIVPFYQPVIDLKTGRIAGMEALARWRHPNRGLLPPDLFMPIAEDSNLIAPLTESMLRQACRDAKQWPEHVHVAVNISPSQFRNPRLYDDVVNIVEEEGFPPNRLEIELTESALVEDHEVTMRQLQAFKDKGIRTALDDFGTGYSSLSHLRDMTFDKIKIDRSFVMTLAENPDNAAIVKAVLSLGLSLGLPTVAEGIEKIEHLEALRNQGCNLGQGYLFSQPMDHEQILALLAAEDAPPQRLAVG